MHGKVGRPVAWLGLSHPVLLSIQGCEPPAARAPWLAGPHQRAGPPPPRPRPPPPRPSWHYARRPAAPPRGPDPHRPPVALRRAAAPSAPRLHPPPPVRPQAARPAAPSLLRPPAAPRPAAPPAAPHQRPPLRARPRAAWTARPRSSPLPRALHAAGLPGSRRRGLPRAPTPPCAPAVQPSRVRDRCERPMSQATLSCEGPPSQADSSLSQLHGYAGFYVRQPPSLRACTAGLFCGRQPGRPQLERAPRLRGLPRAPTPPCTPALQGSPQMASSWP